VEDLSVVALLGRLAISMAIVLALLGLAAKLLRKRGLGNTGGSPATRIEVLARQGLGRTSSVQLVRVAGRTLVLGVTDTSVQLLGDGEALGLEVSEPAAPAATSRRRQREVERSAQRSIARDSHRTPPPDRRGRGRSRPQPALGWGPLLESIKDRTART
jgi:flagellar protein FliO/FliZ